MNIKIFPKGSGERLSTNFRAFEFDCPCDDCTETKIDLDLVEILQKNRDHFGKPISPAAYRCPKHNAETPNAAKASRHMQGCAADFSIDGVSPLEIAAFNESIGVMGIGLYDNFVHVDTRTTKAFWYSHKQEKRETFGGKQGESVEAMSGDLPVLKLGSMGTAVVLLQKLLADRGYDVGAAGLDGTFGKATQKALIRFQTDRALNDGDGLVGTLEWRVLLGL